MRCTFQILYIILLILIKGFVIMQLWGWFILPYFNLPELTFVMAIGIVTMISVVLYLPVWKFDNIDDEFKYNIAIGLKPIILLLVGWIVHLFL